MTSSNGTTTRIAPETERTAYLDIDASASPMRERPATLKYDPRDDSLWVSLGHQCDNAITFDEYHGLVRRWRLDPRIDAAAFTDDVNNGALERWLPTIRAGFSEHWDGSNTVALYSPEAQTAIDDLGDYLSELDPMSENAGVWDAGDWLAQDSPASNGITAETTDEQLATIADDIETYAKTDGVILSNTLETVTEWRDNLCESN